jgi:F-type H+-transporting ATPase subunit epsilon
MFDLSIVTTEGEIFNDQVTSIIAPGTLGYLGLQTGHVPIMTTLAPGKLTISQGQTTRISLMIGEGFLENSRDPEGRTNRCLIVTRTIEFASKQDLDQTITYRGTVENRLRQARATEKGREGGSQELERIDRLIKTAGKKIVDGRE